MSGPEYERQNEMQSGIIKVRGTRAHDVSSGLGVERDVICARRCEVVDDAIDWRHHKVDINRSCDTMALEGLADHWADC